VGPVKRAFFLCRGTTMLLACARSGMAWEYWMASLPVSG